MSEVKQEIDVTPSGTAPADAPPAADKEVGEAAPVKQETSEITEIAKTDNEAASPENKSKHRGGGQRNFNNRRDNHQSAKYNRGKNSKFDPTTMPVTDDASKIRAQVCQT